MARGCSGVGVGDTAAIGFGVGLLCLVAMALPMARADIILLDEYWSPEIVENDVVATEVDTVVTKDPTEARTGECSAKLSNATGWPNVRFRTAAKVTLASLPPGDTEARLWYRTDKWTGSWRLEVWAFHHEAAPAPVRVLSADLDAGGPGGALLADDRWHQAAGVVEEAEGYEQMPKDVPLATYVWLAPASGWGVAHTTYVDRAELVVVDGPLAGNPAPPPVRKVRPRPGAQQAKEGWVWFEAEDAAENNVPPGGVFLPDNAVEQEVLSNGFWVQHHNAPAMAAFWEVNVAEAGTCSLWCRGGGATFRWRWNGGRWGLCTEESGWVNPVKMDDFAQGPTLVSWICLGQVDVAKGMHMLEVEGIEGEPQVNLDCWLLTKGPFVPDGRRKPDGT